MPRNAASGVMGKVAAGSELAAAFLLGALLVAYGVPRLATGFAVHSSPVAQPGGDALRAGLAAAPADPRGWYELARLEHTASGATPTMAKALRLSVLTGPREPDLVLPRLELALPELAVFEGDDRALVREQIRLAWAEFPRGLALLANQRSLAAPIHEAIDRIPGAAEAFDKLLAETDPNAIRS
jgi:hypothetical protein